MLQLSLLVLTGCDAFSIGAATQPPAAAPPATVAPVTTPLAAVPSSALPPPTPYATGLSFAPIAMAVKAGRAHVGALTLNTVFLEEYYPEVYHVSLTYAASGILYDGRLCVQVMWDEEPRLGTVFASKELGSAAVEFDARHWRLFLERPYAGKDSVDVNYCYTATRRAVS